RVLLEPHARASLDDRHRHATLGERVLDRDHDFHDVEAGAAAGERLPARHDALDEVLALVPEGLGRLDLRAEDVAVAQLELELAEAVHVATDRRPLLEDPDLLEVVHVVEHDALPAAHDDDLADLVGIDPADLNVADDAVRIRERDERDVFFLGMEKPAADGAD